MGFSPATFAASFPDTMVCDAFDSENVKYAYEWDWGGHAQLAGQSPNWTETFIYVDGVIYDFIKSKAGNSSSTHDCAPSLVSENPPLEDIETEHGVFLAPADYDSCVIEDGSFAMQSTRYTASNDNLDEKSQADTLLDDALSGAEALFDDTERMIREAQKAKNVLSGGKVYKRMLTRLNIDFVQKNGSWNRWVCEGDDNDTCDSLQSIRYDNCRNP